MSEPTSAQLKDLGNELFKKQDYVGAIIKYTEAIALDDKNAVLYANRAACNHALNKFLDAVDDAHMVLFAVAGALAADWTNSAHAWQKALDALPKSQLSPAEQKQKDRYAACLKAAIARRHRRIVPLSMSEKAGKFPWQIATDMLPELRRAGHAKVSSSAWVIALAYEEFNSGVELMKGMKKTPVPGSPDNFVFHGISEGLTLMSNGFMRDDRIFYFNQSNWVEMYNQQVYLEVTARKAWDSEGLEAIKELAQKRLKENGWDDVRPALAVTVRAWMITGVLEGDGLREQPQAGVEYYRRALDLVEWGRTIWKDVPKASRGAIFEHSFLIGVRSLYLKMFMNAYTDDPGTNSKFLEQLKEEAEDLLKEAEIALRTRDGEPVDPGFISSFIAYPAGVGHAMLGFYHAQSARYTSDPVERMLSYAKAAGEYTTASSKYAEDDEIRALYLNCTLDCMCNAGVPVDNFLMVAFGLRETVPKMKKIWAISELAMGGRDQKIQANLDRADELMKRVAGKTLTLQDPVPLWL
ncbi:hypothetical protein P692DRAFT_20814377 [Suillus brevipes Sb2]|nr:hypothetical protein P692DRAFT_20814377 [Suillus brevipes Sb2]